MRIMDRYASVASAAGEQHRDGVANRYSTGVISHDLPVELLRLLEESLDSETTKILGRLGVGQSWRCLELGAGAGSIARWLAEQRPDGHVVATDTDTRYLDPSAAHSLEVMRHDVVAEDFPPGSFDLVPARYLLANLPEVGHHPARQRCQVHRV